MAVMPAIFTIKGGCSQMVHTRWLENHALLSVHGSISKCSNSSQTSKRIRYMAMLNSILLVFPARNAADCGKMELTVYRDNLGYPQRTAYMLPYHHEQSHRRSR